MGGSCSFGVQRSRRTLMNEHSTSAGAGQPPTLALRRHPLRRSRAGSRARAGSSAVSEDGGAIRRTMDGIVDPACSELRIGRRRALPREQAGAIHTRNGRARFSWS